MFRVARLIPTVCNKSSVFNTTACHRWCPQLLSTNWHYTNDASNKDPLVAPVNSIISKTEHSLDDFSEGDRRRILEIKLELYQRLQEGLKACDPESITPAQWRYILTLPSYNARRCEFIYIDMTNHAKQKGKREKEERLMENPHTRSKVIQQRQKENHIVYNLSHTTLLLRIISQTMNKFHNLKLWNAKMFNQQKIVFDLSYTDYMNKKLAHLTAKQIIYFYTHNRKDSLPFDVHLCNVNSDCTSFQHLQTCMPHIGDHNCSIDVHKECYSDLYPRENLLYLTPYSPNVLAEYNPKDVYVVGAVIEHGKNGPITMMKAKEMGIRTAWPPLGQCMNPHSRKKYLPLNITANIMLSFKNTRKWEESLVHVPQRMQVRPRQERQIDIR